jgi:hypothetical protein
MDTITAENAVERFPELGSTTWQKNQLTRAVRVDGPFEVETTEGTLICKDGYLALDSEDNPYPIDAKVFDATYVRV